MTDTKAKKLLNWSFVCTVAYYALFFIGWSLQLPLFAKVFEYTDDQISNMVTVFFPSVVVVLAVGAVGLTVFNLLLRKKFSSRVFICAAVFSALVFISDRIAKVAIPYVGYTPCTHLRDMGVKDTWHSAELSKKTIVVLDTFLSVFLVAAITLMICAFCIGKSERRTSSHVPDRKNLC